jgi:hypothetical protein
VPVARVPVLRRVPVERVPVARVPVLRADVERPPPAVDFRADARPPRVPSVFAARVTREAELRRVVPPLRDDADVLRRVPVLRDAVLRPPVERELVERRVPVEREPVERVPVERVPVLRRVPVERVPVERVPVERVPVLRRVPVERVELVRRVPVERERGVVLRPLDDRPVEPLLERLLELDLLRAVAMCLLLVGEFGGNTSLRSMGVAPAVIQQETHLSYFEMSSTTSPVCCSDARLATSA